MIALPALSCSFTRTGFLLISGEYVFLTIRSSPESKKLFLTEQKGILKTTKIIKMKNPPKMVF